MKFGVRCTRIVVAIALLPALTIVVAVGLVGVVATAPIGWAFGPSRKNGDGPAQS